MNRLVSQQVSWLPSYEFAAQWAAEYGVDLLDDDLPNPGTPQWCRLPDDDPQKVAALLLRGSKAVLHDESEQQARGEASKAVAGAADWSAISREINQRTAFYAARPWLRRAV
jgi:Protein of unknown function (DUF2742)